MINTLLEHVPLPIKLEVLEALENDSDPSDSEMLDDEATLMISSDEEAELEKQRIRFHELVGRNLLVRERGRSTSSSGGSSVIVMSGSNAAQEPAEVQEKGKRCKTRSCSTTSVASSIATSASEMESCGNIFLHQAQVRLIFNCSFCERRYANMQAFAEHLHDSHKLFTAPTTADTAKQSVVRKSRRKNKVKEDASEKIISAVQVKSELPDLSLCPLEQILDPLESCGNIFVLNRQKLFLICGYCECKYATLELFSQHLRQQHQLLEGPIKETLVAPKQEVKVEPSMLIADRHSNSSSPQPMVAIPEGIALDNNDLLPITPLGCCSNSNSSGARTPPLLQRVSTETPPPDEGEAQLLVEKPKRSKRKRAETIEPKQTNRKTRKTAASAIEKSVTNTRLRRSSANKQKYSKDYTVQPPSSPESATTERLDVEHLDVVLEETVCQAAVLQKAVLLSALPLSLEAVSVEEVSVAPVLVGAMPLETAPKETSPEDEVPMETGPQEAVCLEVENLETVHLDAVLLKAATKEIVTQDAVLKQAVVPENCTLETTCLVETPMAIVLNKIVDPVDVPQETEHHDIIPQEIVPPEIVPQETEPHDIVLEEIVPQEIVPQEIVPQEILPQEIVPQEAVSQEAVTQEAVTQEAVSQEAVSLETVSQEAVSQEAVTQEPVSLETVSQEAVSQEAVFQKAVPQEVESQDAVSQEVALKEEPIEIVPIGAVPQEYVLQAVPLDSSAQGFVLQEAVPLDAALQNTWALEAVPQVTVALETTQHSVSPDVHVDSGSKTDHKLIDEIPAAKKSKTNSKCNKAPLDNPRVKGRKPKPKFKCDQCLKTFQKITRLVEHKRMHTGEKPYKCFVCGKEFRIKTRLAEHSMRHLTEKAFKCNVCGHAVATRQDLTLHQRHHNGDKRHQCEHCSKAFVRGSDLKIHVRIHTGEKPYNCEICNKAFRANQNLIVHRKTHRDEKPFKCDFCDKRFMRNIDRKVHHRTHTGEKPYKCEICNRAYSSRYNVRKHIEYNHGPDKPRIPQKRGPKPKPKQPIEPSVKVKLEKTKKLIDELTVQVMEQIQQQPSAKRSPRLHPEEQQSSNSKKIEQISHEESMQQVSIALKIALEDDDVENDSLVGRQRTRRKDRKITSYFAVVGQKTGI